MLESNVVRLAIAGLAIGISALLPLSSAIQAQQPPRGEKPASKAYSEAVARAKQFGRPLVVFGVSEGCSRCQALKQGLATQPELKLLLTQFVATEVPFGGREFAAIFDDIIRQDKKYRQSIGAPSVFIFDAKGDAVYAGPNHANGMAAGEELKKLLIAGIEASGGVRGPVAEGKPSSKTSLAADVTKARKLLSASQPVAAAATLAPHVQADVSADEQVAAVVKLTGLKVARSKAEEQLDALVQELSKKGHTLVEAAVASAGSGDATRSAVQLAELHRVLGGFPTFVDTFDAAWKELLTKSNEPQLKEQAELIDKARQAENVPDPAEAIAAYKLVISTYPGTKAAELSELRITQLQSARPAPARQWKSKTGQFSVSATLISFDGKSAQLGTSEGKTITVQLDALSLEDQQFLKAAKTQD